MKDILLNEADDFDFSGGDFVIGDSDYQNVMLIIHSHKGEWRLHPIVGFGVSSYINGITNKNVFKRNLRVAIEADNINISNLQIDLSLRALTFEIDTK